MPSSATSRRTTAARSCPSASSAPRASPTSASMTAPSRSSRTLEERNPEIHFVELFNSVEYTEDQYESAMEALIEGAVLAVLVVFLFLRDWRATLISAIAIPLSAIPTFWFMDLLGFTLNSMTLLALEPGRRRAGRRCDRRDREHRPAHAHGQERLSGVDRRGRRDRPGRRRRPPSRSSPCSCRSA